MTWEKTNEIYYVTLRMKSHGNSEIDANLWSKIGDLICLRQLFGSTAVANFHLNTFFLHNYVKLSF